MTAPRRFLTIIWLLVPVAAVLFILATAAVRIRHIDYVSGLAGGDALAHDAHSPTGYAGSVRALVAPERDPASLQWIVQTQEMVSRGGWRLDHVSYDNAPAGRPVYSSSLYRWWLGGVGWVIALIADVPVGAAIERAGLWADPWLHILLLSSVAGALGLGCGRWAMAWGSVAVAGVFPLTAVFLPGRPDEVGLVLVLAALSMVPLAVVPVLTAERRRWPWCILAAVASSMGLAVAVSVQIAILSGLAVSVPAALWVSRSRSPLGSARAVAGMASSWRLWGWVGGGVTLAWWLLEDAPDRLTWDGPLDRVHPVFAVGFVALGEWLAVCSRVAVGTVRLRQLRTWATLPLAVAGLAWVPIELIRQGQLAGLVAGDVLGRVSDLSDGATVSGIVDWLSQRGFSLESVAVVMPILVVATLSVTVVVRARRNGACAGLLVLGGPVAAVIGLALFRSGGWAVANALLVAAVGPLTAGLAAVGARLWLRFLMAACALVPVVLGIAVVVPRDDTGAGENVSPREVHGLIERDLAWWLARQAPEPGAIVLAPPELTAALIYYGGLRGLGTPYRENEDGFRAAVRLSAASAAEGEALAQSRGVRYILVPSWDDFLDEYARLGSNQPEFSLIALLNRWQPPRWLRPVPYLIPRVEGLEALSVAVFEVVDVQDNATALSRLAEFFVQTGRLQFAGQLAGVLKERHPSESAACVARAQVAWARRNPGEFRDAVAALKQTMEDGSAEALTWDQRVNLVLVLAQARETDLARAEAERCLHEMDVTLPRTLTNPSLHQFLQVLETFGLEISEPEIKQAALALLPRELRPDE